jgi:hypothetical protein
MLPAGDNRGVIMTDRISGRLEDEGRTALRLMEEALERLDRWGSGIDAGAHLDLAICRLRERLQSGGGAIADASCSGWQRPDPGALPWSKAS